MSLLVAGVLSAAPAGPAPAPAPAPPAAPAAAAPAAADSGDSAASERKTIGFWEGAALGLVQGVTEFLPVSSSGHLAAGHLVWEDRLPDAVRVAFDVAVHLATLLAMLLYFARDIAALLTTRRKLILWILLGSVPAAAVGLLLKSAFEAMGGYAALLGVAFIFNGLVLMASNYIGVETRRLREMRWGDSVLIGLAQALALVPGISRSGSTISAGLACGLQREDAFLFSFLLGMPAIAGASLLKARDIGALASSGSWGGLVAGFCAALVSGSFAVWLLGRIVRKRNLLPFGLYTVGLGAIVIVWRLFQ